MIGRLARLAYLGVASICLVAHNCVMIAADAAGMALPVAVMISFIAVVLLGYALHCRITFREPASWHGLQRYALAMALNIPLALVTTWAWKDLLHLPMVFAAPSASITMLAINYVLSRWAIVVPAKAVE